MGTLIDKSMQYAFLIAYASAVKSYSSVVDAIPTMKIDEATWDYESTRILEENRSNKISHDGAASEHPMVATAVSTEASKQAQNCKRCRRKGHFADKCYASWKSIKERKGGKPIHKKLNYEK